jgi:hypothetical protein
VKTGTDSVEKQAFNVLALEVDDLPKLDIRRMPLLDEARKEASDLSTDGSDRARRKAGIVFERTKEGREDEELAVVEDCSGVVLWGGCLGGVQLRRLGILYLEICVADDRENCITKSGKRLRANTSGCDPHNQHKHHNYCE